MGKKKFPRNSCIPILSSHAFSLLSALNFPRPSPRFFLVYCVIYETPASKDYFTRNMHQLCSIQLVCKIHTCTVNSSKSKQGLLFNMC